MSLDGPNNEVRVILAGQEVVVVESYRVATGMLTQPAAFSMSLGHGRVVRDLMKKYPARTDFELQIAGTTQFRGKTDGWVVNGSSAGTSPSLIGRDGLAPVYDGKVKAEKSFADVSIKEIVEFVLTEVLGAGNFTLAASNKANRQAMSKAGSGGAALSGSPNLASASSADTQFTAAATSANRKIQAKLGEFWYGDFLKPHLDRAGLFLWCSQGGTFLLSELEPNQAPLYRLKHREGAPGNIVESFNFMNDTSRRFAAFEVWGRRGGGKEERTTVTGRFVDQEMTDLGFTKIDTHPDPKCTTIDMCQKLARRRCAESRRNGWKLSYTVGGHTTREAGGSRTVIWIPDTIVDVDDDELGIFGPHYIESVEHNAAPATTSTINLMRPQDVVFGEAT